MHSNLHTSTHRNVIQGALPFEPSKRPLDCRSLPEEGLPTYGVLPDTALAHQHGVTSIDLNNRLRPILTTNQGKQVLARVSCIRHYIPRTKVPRGESGFTQHLGGLGHVASVARTDVGSNRQLGQLSVLLKRSVQPRLVGLASVSTKGGAQQW